MLVSITLLVSFCTSHIIPSKLPRPTSQPSPRSDMPSDQPRRERASSDRASPIPTTIPKRPSLQNRTLSAPVAGLYRPYPSAMAADVPHKVRQPLIEEDEIQSPTGGALPTSHALKAAVEVCNHVVFHRPETLAIAADRTLYRRHRNPASPMSSSVLLAVIMSARLRLLRRLWI